MKYWRIFLAEILRLINKLMKFITRNLTMCVNHVINYEGKIISIIIFSLRNVLFVEKLFNFENF